MGMDRQRARMPEPEMEGLKSDRKENGVPQLLRNAIFSSSPAAFSPPAPRARGGEAEGDVDVESGQLAEVGRDRRPLLRRRLVLGARFRALGDLLAQRRDVQFKIALVFIQLGDDVVASGRILGGGRRAG